MTSDEIIWRPDAATARRARIARFMAQHGLPDLGALHRRSIEDPEWYWDAVCRDLGIAWSTPYRRVLDAAVIQEAARELPGAAPKQAWTDDYSNIAQVMALTKPIAN